MPIDPQAVVAFTQHGLVEGVDISTGFTDADYISIALPDFPLYSLDLTQTFVDFTSNVAGDFTAGPTASVPFSASVLTLNNGDSELRFPRSLVNVNSINLSLITGVRFRVYANSPCTFRCLSIRLVSKDWTYAPIDRDTLYRKAERPVPPDGSLKTPFAFPTQSDPNIPREWPIIYRADDPPGVADPRPINSSITAWFHSGSLTAGSGDTGGSIFFNTGKASIPDIASLRYTGSLTLEIWANPVTLSDDTVYGLFTKFSDIAAQRSYRFGITSAGELRFDYSSNGVAVTSVVTSGAGVQAGVWTHLAVTFSGISTSSGLPLLLSGPQTPQGSAGLPLLLSQQAGSVVFYKNGAQVGEFGGLPVSIAQTPQPLKIGAWDSAL